MESVAKMENVVKVVGDQCQYGAEIKTGKYRGDPIKKPSGFMTNSSEIAEAMSRRCSGRDGLCSRGKGGMHRPCSGKHALDALLLPAQLRECRSCRPLRMHTAAMN